MDETPNLTIGFSLLLLALCVGVGVSAADVETAVANESLTEDVEIDHRASVGTGIGGYYAELLGVTTTEDETFAFGGEGDTALRIVDTATNDSVTATPRASETTYDASRATFYIYNGQGVINDIRTSVGVFSEAGFEHVDVNVTGDTEMFETGEPYSPYVVELIDTESDTVIDRTDERVTGIGYSFGLEQTETRGDLELSLARDDALDPSWDVEFELYDGHETAFETDVENDADAEAFDVTVDASDLEAGEYNWLLPVYKPGQEVPVKTAWTVDDIVVDVLYEYDPVQPTVGENVTFDASVATETLGDIDSYQWNVSGGTTVEGEIVTYSFDDIGTYEVTLTVVTEDGEVRSMTDTVSTSEYPPLEQSVQTIRHTDDGSGYTSVPAIRSEEGVETVPLGGDAITTFRIFDADGESFSVRLDDDAEHSPHHVGLTIYDGTGVIERNPTIELLNYTTGETTAVDVSVSGDPDLFAEADPVSTYTVELLDSDGETITTTEERTHVVAYEGAFDLTLTDDELEISLPRDDVVEDDWEVTLEVMGEAVRSGVVVEDVENDPDEAAFTAAVDADELETGALEVRLVLEDPETGEPLANLYDTPLLTADGPLTIGEEYQPRDNTADGLFEDLTGDGRLGPNDIIVFFEHFQDEEIQENGDYFDFSGTGDVSFSDVVALFERL